MAFVTNGFAIERKALELVKRMSVKNARLCADAPIKLAAMQADYAYMANEICPATMAEYELREGLLKLSGAALHALDNRLASVYALLAENPQGAFEKKNGEPMDAKAAAERLDLLAETAGNAIDEQDRLLRGVRDADRKRAAGLPEGGCGEQVRAAMRQLVYARY